MGLATNVLGVTGDVIYGADSNSTNGKIVGINTSGECIEVITHAELGGFRPRAMEIRTIGGQDHLFASGRWWDGGWRSRFYTKNLTTGHSSTCGSDYGGDLGWDIRVDTDLTVDNSGDFLYYIWRGRIYGYELTKTGNNYCPSDEGWDRKYIYGNGSSKHRKASGIDMSRDSGVNDIMYVVSHSKNKIQKIQLLTDTTVVSLAEAGKRQRSNNR